MHRPCDLLRVFLYRLCTTANTGEYLCWWCAVGLIIIIPHAWRAPVRQKLLVNLVSHARAGVICRFVIVRPRMRGELGSDNA